MRFAPSNPWRRKVRRFCGEAAALLGLIAIAIVAVPTLILFGVWLLALILGVVFITVLGGVLMAAVKRNG